LRILIFKALECFICVWAIPLAMRNPRCHKDSAVCSRWKVGLVVEVRIIGVVQNQEPALLGACENLKSIAKALDRLPKPL
jgi:hypothetical protein